MSKIQNVSEAEEISNGLSKSEVRDDIQLSANSFYYTWTLRNFLECTNFSDAVIFSPEFQFAGGKWRLWLQAICKNNELDKVKIRLVKSEKCGSACYINYKFSFLNEDGSLISKEAASHFDEASKSIWGHRLTFRYDKNKNDASFIVNDKLTVQCKLLVLSSVACYQIPVRDSSNEAHIPVQIPTNRVINYPGTGILRSGLNNQMPKLVKHAARSRRPFMHERPLSVRLGVMFSALISVLLLQALATCIVENPVNRKSLVNMREVNELIIDSTLKIKSIADALNLTDVKMKSMELLAWYHENYNVSDINFARSDTQSSSRIIPDIPMINVSSNIHKAAAVNETDNEHESNELKK